MAQRLLGPTEVMEIFGISRATLRQMCLDNDIGYVALGKRRKFRHSDIDNYLREKEVPAHAE